MKTSTMVLLASTLVTALPPPHPAVEEVRRLELTLPPHLRKPALNNPRLWDVLPITSLLHEGEKPVYQREADEVPRRDIYNILTHAGFVPRRQHAQPQPWSQDQNQGPWNQGQSQPPWNQGQSQSPWNHGQNKWQHRPESFSSYAPNHYYEEQAPYQFQHRNNYQSHTFDAPPHPSPEHLQYL